MRPIGMTPFVLLLLISCGEPDPKEKEEKGGELEKKEEEGVALFFGNSLTAGQGVKREEAFPSLIQEKCDSMGWRIDVINAGVSGETSAGGESRVNWVLEQQDPDLFFLELGANDGLRGIDPQETRENLQSIIDKVREKQPGIRIVLAGMKVPPNMGASYSEEFSSIFPELVERNETGSVPFLLKGVAGEDSLNQDDGIHPTAEGHRIIAKTVWKQIREDLKAIAPKGTDSDGGDHL